MAWQFPGTCRECGGRIVPGQPVDWAQSTGVQHVDCPDPLAPERPPCPVCFLVHPEGACDR